MSKSKVHWLRRLYWRLVRSNYAKDIYLDLQIESKRESAHYVKTHMSSAIVCSNRDDLHRIALDKVTVTGLLLEMGVKSGGSIRKLAAMTTNIVHGFDSFEGLPEDWGGTPMRKGKFSTNGRIPKVPANVRLHPGWFADSLPQFIERHNGPIAFMHVDCDLYSSTKTVLDSLTDKIVVGTVIVFDEYFNYPNWQQHEFLAFQEFVKTRGIKYEYLGFTAQAGSVALRITKG